MRHRIASLAAAAVLMPLVATVPAAAETWDMPTAYSGQNFVTKGYVAFAEAVKERTGGALDIVVHPAGSLYKGSDILRAVREGQVPIGARYMGAHASEDPMFGIDAVPFLATSRDEAWKLYQASRPALEAAFEERGLKLLFTAIWPPQGLWIGKEVDSVADMQGVKFRAYDAATTRLAELMGAVPTKTEAAEIAQAFSTGVAESMMASAAIGVFQKMWDYVDYYYTVNAWLPKSAVFVNLDAWNALDDETREAVTAAAAAAEETVWAAMDTANEDYLVTLRQNGMTVAPPSAQLSRDLRGIGETLSDEWAGAAGDRGKAVIEAYRAQ